MKMVRLLIQVPEPIKARWMPCGEGHDGQRVYSALVGGTFQTGSGDGPERTVSDGASREKRSGFAE